MDAKVDGELTRMDNDVWNRGQVSDWVEWGGVPSFQKDVLTLCVRKAWRRGTDAPAKAGEERVAIRPVAFKHLRQKVRKKTPSPHSRFYFTRFHLIFHVTGAAKESL